MNVLRRQISLDTDQKWPRPTVWLPLPYAIQNGWVLSQVCYPRIVEPSREGKVYRSGVLLEVQGLIELGPLHSHTPNSLLLELPFLIVSKDESSMILRKKSKLHGVTSRKIVNFVSRGNPTSHSWTFEFHTGLQVCWRHVLNRTRKFTAVIWSSCDGSGKWHRVVG